MGLTWPDGSREFVDHSRVGRIATSDARNAPHVVPVCYARLQDRLYWVVDGKPKRNPLGLKRLRNIGENPRVAIVVDRYDDDWSQLAWVLMRGRAEIVAQTDEYAEGLIGLRSRYSQYRTMTLEMETHPMVRIDVEQVKAWSSSRT